MSVVRLASFEVRRFLRARITRAALVALLLLPLLYGGLYLWSTWAPADRFDQVPAALVNQDQPVTVDGRRIAAGHELTEQLLRRPAFAWRAVDARTAAEGVRDGRYYLAVTVPADFSRNLSSPSGPTPIPSQLRVETNDAKNYVFGQVSKAALTEIQRAAAQTAIRGYFDRVLVAFGDIRAGNQRAAAGAGQLADGSDKLAAGTGRLADGLGTAHDGSQRVTGGLGRLRQGSARLADGSAEAATGVRTAVNRVDQVTDRLLPLLRDRPAALTRAAGQLADAAELLADQANAVPRQTQRAATEAAALADQAERYAADHPDAAALATRARQLAATAAKANTAVQGNAGRLAELASTATGIATQARALAAGAPALIDRIEAARGRLHQLADGLDQLATGADQLRQGTGQAYAGAVRLDAGLDRLHTGADRLDGGADQVSQGAHRLADGLAAGADRIPAYSPAEREQRAGVMSDPVRADAHRLNPAPNYGTGLAPYFLALALWVGGMFTFMLLRPLGNRALASAARSWRVALAGWLPAALVGTVQAAVVLGVLVWAVGLDPVRPWAMLGYLVLTALSFAAVLQWVHARFGATGRLLSVVLLLVQLTAAGGTYPVETGPGLLRAIHPYLPISHVLEGLRPLVTGGSLGATWVGAAVLAGFAVGGLVLTAWTTSRQRRWTLGRLRPVLVV